MGVWLIWDLEGGFFFGLWDIQALSSVQSVTTAFSPARVLVPQEYHKPTTLQT